MKTKNEVENLTQSTWRFIVHIYRAVVAYKWELKQVSSLALRRHSYRQHHLC